MRKYNRNLSLIPIKTNNNSSKINNTTLRNIKTTNSINNQTIIKKSDKKRENNLLIYVRCRPLSLQEKILSSNEIVTINNNKYIDLKESNRNNILNFSFDYVFDKNKNQNIFFELGIKHLIDGLFEGINTCIFTYGAKNSGKTFTMMGTDSIPGIIALTLKEILNRINILNDKEYFLKISFFEKYNDDIIDLLKNKKEGEINNSDLTEVMINNYDDVLKILEKRNKKKDKRNLSDSNYILQIILEKKIDSNMKKSKFNFIDSLNWNPLLEETNNNIDNIFNFGSLLKYKDSKIIKLLEDSIKNNSKIVIIANISPSITCFEDTYNTLKNIDKIKKVEYNKYNINDCINKTNYLKKEVNHLKEQIENKNENNFNQNLTNFNENINKNNKNNKITNFLTFYYSGNIQKEEIGNCKIDLSLEKKVKNNNSINIINEKEFESLILELRKACENQVVIKQKMIIIQREINREKNKIKKENNLKNDLIINMNKYKECTLKIGKIYNEINEKNNLTEIQKYILNLIMKNSSHKIQMLDNKYNNIINLTKIDIQEEYISELEKQIKIRDDILIKNGIDINMNIYSNFKELKNLRNDYLIKNKNNLDFHQFKKKEKSSSYNKDNSNIIDNDNNHYSISLKNIKIKNYYVNNQIENKINNPKKISNEKTLYNNINIQKDKDVFKIFKQNSNIINNNIISYRKGKETQRNMSNLDMIFNDVTYDSDFLYKNKKILINKNVLNKASNKRNINRKVFLEKLIQANKSIN